MKSAKIVLALVALFGFAASANAANQVWFEADGVANTSRGVLELTASPTQDVSWTITAYANVDGTEWVGYAVDLFSASDVTFADWANLSPFVQTVVAPTQMGAGSMVGGNASNFFGGFTGQSALFSFTLTKAAGEAGVAVVDFEVGANEFAQNDFMNPSPTMDVAGVATINGNAGQEADGVIKITTVPEPATAALLVLGGIALIRRRS